MAPIFARVFFVFDEKGWRKTPSVGPTGLLLLLVTISDPLVRDVAGRTLRRMRSDVQASGDIFDYVVIGAGSAGCVVASRLSENSGNRILLLEAGGSDRDWRIDMPLSVGTLLESGEHNWNYLTEPEPYLNNRRIAHPRGRVVGGSSSINGMVYTRGHGLDYDNWAGEHGCAGWAYADLLPYFKRSERFA